MPVNVRSKKGLLKIRKELNLFSNLRPIKGFDSLLHASPLKEKNIKGSDILIVRELTGGLYFGEPRERRENGTVAVDKVFYCREEIERNVYKGIYNSKIN